MDSILNVAVVLSKSYDARVALSQTIRMIIRSVSKSDNGDFLHDLLFMTMISFLALHEPAPPSFRRAQFLVDLVG